MTQTARRCVIIGGADIQNYERLRLSWSPATTASTVTAV